MSITDCVCKFDHFWIISNCAQHTALIAATNTNTSLAIRRSSRARNKNASGTAVERILSAQRVVGARRSNEGGRRRRAQQVHAARHPMLDARIAPEKRAAVPSQRKDQYNQNTDASTLDDDPYAPRLPPKRARRIEQAAVRIFSSCFFFTNRLVVAHSDAK